MLRGWLAVASLVVGGVAVAQEAEVAEATELSSEAPLPEAVSTEQAEAAPAQAEAAPAQGEAEVAPSQAEPASAVRAEAPPAQQVEAPQVEPEIPVLAVRSRKLPIYPDELQVLYGQQTIRCEALVWVDKAGRPQRISMVDCPDGFHLAALEAMGTWRWEKPRYAPPGGAVTRASTGFIRKDRNFFPGVTYFRVPSQVTADPELPVTLKSGKMPKFPRQVNAGDDVCLVELVVTASGATTSPIIDECAPPFRDQLKKVVRSWKWTWKDPPKRGETRTVLAEVVFRI